MKIGYILKQSKEFSDLVYELGRTYGVLFEASHTLPLRYYNTRPQVKNENETIFKVEILGDFIDGTSYSLTNKLKVICQA